MFLLLDKQKPLVLCSASKGTWLAQMRHVVVLTRVFNVLAEYLQRMKDGNPPVPIELLVQAKAKELSTDAVPKFIEAYSSYTRVATLVKKTYHGTKGLISSRINWTGLTWARRRP